MTEKAKATEGDIHAYRDDAALNAIAGHGAGLAEWEASEAGKEFIAGESDRNKEAVANAKATAKEADKSEEDEKKFTEDVKDAAKPADAPAKK